MRREAWLERRTVEERSVAEVPAAAPVTDPAPVPAGGRTSGPSPSGGGPLVPGHPGPPRLKPRPPGYGPPDVGVLAPAPRPRTLGPLAPGSPRSRTPDGTWITLVTRSQGGGTRKGSSPLYRDFGNAGLSGRSREGRAPTIDLRKGSWKGRKRPPLPD